MIRVVSPVLHSSIIEVVKLVETELNGLSSRRSTIKKRIRSLHLVLHGLQAGVGLPAAHDTHAELRTLAKRPRRPVPGASNGAAAAHGDFLLQFDVRRKGKSDHLCCKLRTACRIALMEVGHAASAEEILSQIVRRGSYSFMNTEHGIAAIVQTLIVMTELGETQCLDGGASRRWERRPLEETQ
jgi:hypothetical protein